MPLPGPKRPNPTPKLQLFFLSLLLSSLASKLSPLSLATNSLTGLLDLSIPFSLTAGRSSGDVHLGTPKLSNVGVLDGAPRLSAVGVRPDNALGGDAEPSCGDVAMLLSSGRSCRRGGEIAREPVRGREVVLLAPDMARRRVRASSSGRAAFELCGRSGVHGHGIATVVSATNGAGTRGGVTRIVVVVTGELIRAGA